MTEEQRKVHEGLMAYYAAHKGGQFVPAELVQQMEPVFRETGYREPPAKGRRPHILILRDDAAGDFVLSSAFLREVRRLYPGAHITLFCSLRNEELARCCPYIDNLLVNNVSYDSQNVWEIMREVIDYVTENFLPLHFDLAFSGRLGLRSANLLLMYISGALRRVGFTQDRIAEDGRVMRQGWDMLLTVPVPVRTEPESDVDRDLFLLEYLLQLPIENRRLEVWTLAAERRAAEAAVMPLLRQKGVKRLYAIMPSTSEKFREWPLERFEELLRRLLQQESDLGFLIMGGPADRALAETLAEKLPGRALALAGKLPFRVSAEAVGLCRKYIGDDTALMHIAAAKGVPVLTTFPYPASLGLTYLSCPIRFQPYGVPSVVVIPPKALGKECKAKYGTGCNVRGEHHCILGITVEKMLQGYSLLEKRIAEGSTHALILQ